jgi:hypothetical protein
VHKSKRALVKVYNWEALTYLVIQDMCRANNIPVPKHNIHYLAGLDAENHPFIRLDLNPLRQSERST